MSLAAVTTIDIMNKVLVRLREDTVSTVLQTDYSVTLLGFLNDAKREVEDAFNWDCLQDVIQITTADGTSSYAVRNVGNAQYTNQRTRVLDVYNQTDDNSLVKTSRSAIRAWNNTTPETNTPFYYSLNGYTSDQDIQLELYPTPNGVYTLDVAVINPQDDVDSENTVISVPWNPVFLRTLYFAIQERGEDAGAASGDVMTQYVRALSDAIAYEQRHQFEGTRDGDWYVP